ncbi:hypothetical protein Z968_06060 [Clostridium novyi A str. 4552]|uniref:TIGR02679 family protein n=1 Tax=Clostridium novyi A str. 4552 TaxID=1444289 RepID=A0A0A0I5B8_CLONO|nr:TIGR02679 domain-containing protein [Clostridium novyi]KGM96599.1 hypothetical protein Z968_06060 [Clostridium novyi A str. 4552]
MSKEIEALKFFRDKKEYHRILIEIFKKYKSLGKLSGTFKLKNLTKEEQMILAPLNHKYFVAREANVSIKKFIEYFCSGKFEQIDFTKVLSMYFKDDLITYKEEKMQNRTKKEDFFHELIYNNRGTNAENWIREMISKKNYGYNIINTNYGVYEKNDKICDLKVILDNVFRGFNLLKFQTNYIESLPIFSSKVTRNPHYFDINTMPSKILIHGICYELKREYPKNAEEIAEILYNAGILRDEVSNFVVTFGLKAYKEDMELDFIKSFTEFQQPLILTLGNLNKIDKFTCNKDKLFIFENPSLFSEVIKKTIDLKPSIICTSGQLKLASLVLLDKIIKNVEEIYYSGDFDPEGIFIANKLRMRYKNKLKFWRFRVEDYIKSVSHKEIPYSRMTILDNIKDRDIKELIEKIKEKGLAGYQELLIKDYVKDIRNIIG